MHKIIVITSGKGGVGKTTTAINLGVAMNYFGRDALLIDGNLSTPNVGINLNAAEVPVSLNHVISRKADPIEAVYVHESGLKVIPSSLSLKELKKMNYSVLKEFKKEFQKISPFVIIDSAAGLGIETQSVLELADELIIVTNPELPAVTDALKTIKLAESMKKRVLGAVINRVKKDDIELQPDVVREMLEIPILGMVPEDINVQKSVALRDSVLNNFPKSKSSRAYKEIAARILDIPYDSDKDRESVMERVLKRLGLRRG